MKFEQEHKNVRNLISHIHKRTIPKQWESARERINKDANHLDNMLKRTSPPKIYGVNTLVGHLDNVSINEQEVNAFQHELLENHAIGIGESYSDYEIKCITYAKLHAFSLGGSGITPDLYDHLVRIVKEQKFPLHVPKSSSYSCGDVIPASHWASEITAKLHKEYKYDLKRKEGLSLINGSFVHVGIAIAKLSHIQSVLALYNFNSVQYAKILNNNQDTYTKNVLLNEDDSMHLPLHLLKEASEIDWQYNVQHPVSIRSYPQVASALFNSIKSYMNAIEEQLTRRSDNPIVLFEEDTPISQASFLAPMISLATSQLMDALLLTMWQVERRVHFLLSGEISGIPLNARDKDNQLGYIQVPKLISAKLEESRLQSGRRTFASGSSTSYGIEDIWTNGLSVLETLDDLCKNMNTMMAIELSLLLQINDRFLKKLSFDERFQKYIDIKNFKDQYTRLIDDHEKQQIPINYDLQPFDTLTTHMHKH